MPEDVYEMFSKIVEASGRSQIEVVRLGLGLFALVADAQRQGNRFVVIDAAGTPLKEIVLPPI